MLIDSLYRKRSWLAGMPSLIIIALSLLRASQVTPLKLPDEPKPPLKLRIVDLQPPEHVIQQPSSVTLPHTEPVKSASHTTRPTPSPAPVISAPATPQTTAVAAPPVSNAVVAPQTSPPPLPKPAAETPSEPPSSPAPVSANLEAGYIAKLRSYIDSSKRYPTGREASLMRPAGMVRIWLELDRNGHLLDAGIEQSSHSMLLDHAALSTVRRGEYPSFPADVWPGGNSHRFIVDINYTPAS